jgi:hypothetical protein
MAATKNIPEISKTKSQNCSPARTAQIIFLGNFSVPEKKFPENIFKNFSENFSGFTATFPIYFKSFRCRNFRQNFFKTFREKFPGHSQNVIIDHTGFPKTDRQPLTNSHRSK